jgi:hypothetical protein
VQDSVHFFSSPYSTQTRSGRQGASVPLHVTQSPSSGHSQVSPRVLPPEEPPPVPEEPPVPEDPPVPPVPVAPMPHG